ncbi:hypothetical protein RRG08_049820 [Elysia crispata]|uniref:Uncharacterized protein n=1 Tax=Elysia crispata TaxID=231223 RepID=A0AAE0XQT5_9GAST|nr:hypothetical protein RRG08_049820 [Elysia crispata]
MTGSVFRSGPACPYTNSDQLQVYKNKKEEKNTETEPATPSFLDSIWGRRKEALIVWGQRHQGDNIMS